MTLLQFSVAVETILTRIGRRALPMLLMACAAYANAAAAEDAVLLASTAPGYAPGTVIAAGERLRVPEGASVTLLFRSGQMLRLRGPAEGSLEPPAPASRDGIAAALAEVFRMRGVDASVMGATRASAFGRPRPRSRGVAVEVGRSGTYCIGPADTVWLTRVPRAESAELVLRRRGNHRSLAWPAGAARVEWPADVLIEDGDRFEVLAEGQLAATLTFRAVTGTAMSDSSAIAEGVLLGCHEQYEAALRSLARATVPPELWLGTDRGHRAVYRAGETVRLTAVAAIDGWLYCVAVPPDGTAIPVFPVGAMDGARLPAGMPAAIPGPRQAGTLQAGPRGTTRIRCWLADRDIGPELPHAMFGPDQTRLSERMTAGLDTVFSSIAGTRIATATVELRAE